MVRATLKLGRIAGVEVGVNWSALVMVLLIVAGLAGGQLPDAYPGHSAVVYVGHGAVIHELAGPCDSRKGEICSRRPKIMCGGVLSARALSSQS